MSNKISICLLVTFDKKLHQNIQFIALYNVIEALHAKFILESFIIW